MERTMKQAELSNEVNFSDQVTSRNNEETSFVQASEVEGFPITSNEINSESTQRGALAYVELNRELQTNNFGTTVCDNAMEQLCTNSENESGFNQNINTECQQKFDVDSILSSVLHYCYYIIEGTPIQINSRQTDEFRKLLESPKGLSEQISQKDYLEYVNDWTESHKNEISIVKNDQISRNSTYDGKLSYKCSTSSSARETDLNEILLMRRNVSNSTSMTEFPQNEIPNLFSDSPVNEDASVSDSCFSGKEQISKPKNCKESQPSASFKRDSVDLNTVTKKLSTRNRASNADMLIYKERKFHVCDVCHKSFKRKYDLNSHLVIHSDERPFTCKQCGEKFKWRKCLIYHKKIHTGERLPCQICKMSFTLQSNLDKHSVIHSGKGPHFCTICGKSFTQSRNLKTHELTHTGEKPHECTICNKKFSRKQNLNRHLMTHKHK